MHFEFDDEQKMLRDTVRDLLAKTYGDAEARRRAVATDPGYSTEVWRQLAETGILGLTFSEEDGGVGAGPEELMAVMVEIGRVLAPEPLLDAVVVPGGLIGALGSAEQRGRLLPEVAEGSLLLAFAHAEPGVRWPSTTLATTATPVGDGWTISGTKNPVLRGDGAATLVVSAVRPDGTTGLFLVQADAAGVTRTAYRTHDGLRGAQVVFDGAAAEELGTGDASAAITEATVRAQAGLCAEAVGAMEESLRLTSEYLKQRKQFGVVLAKFQTLTQRAADMYVSLELAQSMNLYATMTLADGIVDPVVASRTKLQISTAARHIGQEAVQLHGGIGVTAEYPVGHYFSRLTAIEHTLGGRSEHLKVLADTVSDHEMVDVTG
ncbi:acyl-CoA dehydrogenase family protein [Millisia brevis]|uniref:acyl-CoA dehydrogenase family protein n=1 Tax=Millisia brevis TaxID=264148 RepID=UPI000836E4BC|nr:acyl-CoA dehydrogenase family protein [Millisia brevis]